MIKDDKERRQDMSGKQKNADKIKEELKISLTEQPEGWHWCVLRFNEGWYNTGSGIETDYMKAAQAAHSCYDSILKKET